MTKDKPWRAIARKVVTIAITVGITLGIAKFPAAAVIESTARQAAFNQVCETTWRHHSVEHVINNDPACAPVLISQRKGD